MGEFADMALDRLWDDYWDSGDLDYDEDHEFSTLSVRARPRCRRCKAPLSFELNHNVNWVPCNADGTPHSCEARATDEDFPAL